MEEAKAGVKDLQHFLPITNGGIHVLPQELIDNIVSGEVDIESISNWKKVVVAIIKEWALINGRVWVLTNNTGH
jgi:hypothetical protein